MEAIRPWSFSIFEIENNFPYFSDGRKAVQESMGSIRYGTPVGRVGEILIKGDGVFRSVQRPVIGHDGIFNVHLRVHPVTIIIFERGDSIFPFSINSSSMENLVLASPSVR